jgi:hypothetical protein
MAGKNPFDKFDQAKDNPFDKFDAPSVPTAPDTKITTEARPEDDSWLETAGKWLAENGEVPGGVTGAITGTLAGSPLGPPGMLVGGILGGAIGSSGGSLASDAYKGDDLDYVKAMEEFALSVGIDLVTLGAGKVLKPLWVAGKRTVGATAKEAVEELVQKMDNVSPAVKDALQILEKTGSKASLTPYQTGVASRWEVFKENLGRTGIVSKSVYDKNLETIKQITIDEMDKVLHFSKTGGNIPADDELGRGVMDVLSSARSVVSKEYGAQLDEVGKRLSPTLVPLNPIRKGLNGFLKKKSNVDSLGVSTLDAETNTIINKLITNLGESDKASGKYLIEFEKALKKEIDRTNAFGDTFNGTVAKELGDLSTHMKGIVRGVMRVADPEAASKFRLAQETFGKTTNTLFPPINANYIRKAGKNAYTSLGHMLASPQSQENATAMLTSLKEGYGKLSNKEKLKLEFKTEGAALNHIRRAYLERMVPDAMDPSFDIKHYTKLAGRLKDSSFKKHAKLIMGDEYKGFNQLVNLMSTAAKKPESGLATLFMRSKEYTSLMGVGAAAATGVIDVGTAGLSAVAILGSPYVMARVATSGKHIKKLIQIDKMAKAGVSPEKIAQVASVIVNDVMPKDWARGALGELPFVSMNNE